MAFYKVEMDVQLLEWAEISAIVESDSLENALAKAKTYDFKDLKIKNIIETKIIEHDRVEGIAVESII